MKPLDKNYLSLQFKNIIYSKNGTEFQSFFENIMEKAFPDFQKIRPYGKKGDGGNDGYRKLSGIYYQVYAPNTPKVKESDASDKLTHDFYRLKNEWSEISKIKEYNFSFNDKYCGSVQLLEEAISRLEIDNPNIRFVLFLAKDLEKLFFSLSEADILNLGFDIDIRKAVSNTYEYLNNVEIELDRENSIFAHKILESSKNNVTNLNDEGLSLEYDILECRCLQKLEMVDEARKKYEAITKRYPGDPRAFLYLAEIHLKDKDFIKNEELLDTARRIKNEYWLLELEHLVRVSYLGEIINTSDIDESSFPDNPKIKSNFYRLYASHFENSGNKTIADSFIEKAIHLNKDRLNNYLVKLSITESRIFSDKSNSPSLQRSDKLLDEINNVEEMFSKFGDINNRSKVVLNLKKLTVHHVKEDYSDIKKVTQETFELIITCYFDSQIDEMLSILLRLPLPINDFTRLLDYLRKSRSTYSDRLLKVLIFQFNIRDALLTEGRRFFEQIGNQKYLDFINALDNSNYEDILNFLEGDVEFAITIAITAKSLPDLRKRIIDSLPDDNNIKDKLLLLLNFDEDNIDDAFELLKKIDLANFDHIECMSILELTQRKKAWDFVIIILEKLIKKETNIQYLFNLKLQLFNAYFNLEKYIEVIETGEELLSLDSSRNILNSTNKEALLARTILACLERGNIDNTFHNRALTILEKYHLSKPSFEFIVGIEANVYLKKNQPNDAFNAVVEGIKRKKILTPEEYAKLFFLLSIEIGNRINLNHDSLSSVDENTFIKLKNNEDWYFLGNDDELDAIKINKLNKKYTLFVNEKLGNKIVFEDKYTLEHRVEIIEIILPIEKYIFWKVIRNFQKLSEDDVLDGIQRVSVPKKEGGIDTKYLLQFLEDIDKKSHPFFEMYYKDNNLPLAMLSVSEGGIVDAIGRIQNENKGFINFSTGSNDELENQKNIARNIIDKKIPFYIDGTSALVLSESGLLQKIYPYLPNLKLSQSIIGLLINISGRFGYTPGQAGHMGYAQGEITFSPVNQDSKDKVQANLLESIKLLESNSENISVISLANKIDCFSEQKVPSELCDACILAQNENIPVLTEDYLYLMMNEIETKKKSPSYFSSFALLRVLYEEGKVNFDDYLDYFYYLSSYRFRFLPVGLDDIEKAIFGDGIVRAINSENIRKLNFTLTLSEEYGVTFQVAFTLLGRYLLTLILDDTVLPNTIERILVEIIETFPKKIEKKTLGKMLLNKLSQAVEQNKERSTVDLSSKISQEKLDKLLHVIEIYNFEKIWIPN